MGLAGAGVLQIADRTLPISADGFLSDAGQWDRSVAEALAAAYSIELSEAHWNILGLLRAHFEAGNEPPSMRKLSGLIKSTLGQEYAGSIYLMKLFGPSPAKMAARLAGLPKPKNCF